MNKKDQKRKRIVLIDNTRIDSKEGRLLCPEGIGSFAVELINLGCQVIMFGQMVEGGRSCSVFDIEANGIKVAGLRKKPKKLQNYLCLYIYALKYIWNSDYVYLFYPNAFKYIPFFCMIFGKRYGLYIRGDKGIEDTISHIIYKHSDIVLTVSSRFTLMVNNVTGRLSAATIRPMIVYDDKDIVRDRVYQKKGMFNLLMLSRIQKEKGVGELIEAMAELKSAGIINIHLTLTGDGDFLDQARNDCRIKGLEKEIEITGGIYNKVYKGDLYKKADIYILPTYFNEGFPRTLYEAMIFGTPIITTFVGGIPEIMTDKINCLRIEPRSVDSIVNSLLFALGHYEDMIRMAKNATELVEKIVDRKRPSHAQQFYQLAFRD